MHVMMMLLMMVMGMLMLDRLVDMFVLMAFPARTRFRLVHVLMMLIGSMRMGVLPLFMVMAVNRLIESHCRPPVLLI